jgi:hypothetical protein
MTRRHLLGMCLVLAATAWPARGHAYRTLQNVCGGPISWTNDGDIAVIDLPCSAGGFPGLIGATDPSGTSFTQVRQAMDDALWMWVRDGQSDTRLFHDRSVCGSGDENGGWFPLDGRNVLWFEGASLINSPAMCASNSAAACTPYHVGACAWPGLHTDMLDFHTVVANDFPQQIVNQDSLAECFDGGHNLENLFVHEIGHAYGLDHGDAVMNSMHSTQQRFHNCHVGQGFSVTPFPDDTAGLMAHNDRSPATAQYNATGTPWVWMDGNSTLDTPPAYVPTSGSVVIPTIRSTLESMYPYSWTFFVTFVVVSEAVPPRFDWSTNTWVYTPVASSQTITASNWGQQARTLSMQSWSFPVTALTRGVAYRVWGRVWSFNAETDLADNVFPTNVVFTRP